MICNPRPRIKGGLLASPFNPPRSRIKGGLLASPFNPPRSQGWELVYQRTHAYLSMQLLQGWRPELRHQRWLAILNATSQHDFGWEEWNGEDALEDDGRPRPFFRTPCEQAEKLARRAVRSALQQDRFCALLVARHIVQLYKDPHPQLAELLQSMQVQIESWAQQLGLDDREIEQSYDYLLWADTASLLLCVEDSEFQKVLELKLHGQPYTLRHLQGDDWGLQPWPYQQTEHWLHWDAMLVEQERFRDAEEFLAVLESTPAQLRRVRLVPLA